VTGTVGVFNPSDPTLLADPYPTYARLRTDAPVAYLPENDMWVVSRHADVSRVLRETAVFSSKAGMSPDLGRAGGGVDYRIGAPNVRVLIATDPPEHQVFRAAVAGAFTPRAIGALTDRVTEIARTQVRRLLAHNGDADFFSHVAEPVPVLVLAELLGVPRDQLGRFRDWSNTITADLDQTAGDAGIGRGMDMFRFFTAQLRGRRHTGRPTLFDGIARAREGGVSDRELLAFCAFLLVAGIETTTNLMTNLLAALWRFPHVERALRDDPALVPAAVEEGLRYDTSVQALWRGSTQPTRLGDVDLPAGARILVLFGSANRDERHFAEPDEFLLTRKTGDHLGFGHGPHFCLGARLARLEISAVLTELFAATKAIEPRGPGERTRSVLLRGFTSQPVSVQPT